MAPQKLMPSVDYEDEGRKQKLSNDRQRIITKLKDMVKLGAGLYFDPSSRMIYRKVGTQITMFRHDRRRRSSDAFKGNSERRQRTQAEAENAQFRMIQGGLFLIPKKKRYIKNREIIMFYIP
jgi:hypothetical protein